MSTCFTQHRRRSTALWGPDGTFSLCSLCLASTRCDAVTAVITTFSSLRVSSVPCLVHIFQREEVQDQGMPSWRHLDPLTIVSFEAYYGDHMTDDVIALLLNWGPIFGIVFFPIQTWMLTRSSGFKSAAQLGAVLVFAGSVIRMVPTWAGQDFRQNHGAAIFFLHAGQILNAAAGPLCMGTESKLSCIWCA